MEKERFYAHSTDCTEKSDWQLLADHLSGVGKLAADKAAAFGGEDCARIGGLLHDLGKYTREFQLRLSGEFSRLDHATWGAKIACQRYGPMGRLIAYGIAGHHAGLANGRDAGERSCLNGRLRADLFPLLPDWEQEIALPQAVQPPEQFRRAEGRGQFQLAFLGRMLFSCLVDADFLDTEAFYVRTEGKPVSRAESLPSLEALKEKLDTYLTKFQPDSAVNKLRAEILSHVRSKADLETGLFSLTVPTGGGKTLASLAFALDHAIKHGLRRVIFVIPFTSIVEQNAAVFREALGELGESAVLEHHSAFIDDPGQSPAAKAKLRLAMENWEAPIVVTTAVQFFESLFADRPSKCRKLHNIAGSVVILDEAQCLPLKLLRPCVAAIDELALNYRSSLVLCTATQPALNAPDFKNGLQNVRELAPNPRALFEQLKRVQLHHVGGMTDEALAESLKSQEQVLCIVNNRRHARTLYQSIADEPGARHLTTLMCAKHRSEVLSEVRMMLRQGQPCRLVSTSLIEAGVDVDFPAVLRAEAGLDSIAQAAGRCNREGRYSPEQSQVSVFSVGSEWPTPPELEQFAQASRAALRQHSSDPLSLAAVESYFRELYWVKGDKALDAHNLLGMIESGQLEGLPYETLARKFRMIDSLMLPVIVPFDETARAALSDLCYVESVGGIARRLQPYLVQLPRNGFEALRKAGAIQPVNSERFGEQFMELVNPELYDNRFGLSWDDPYFIKAEATVF